MSLERYIRKETKTLIGCALVSTMYLTTLLTSLFLNRKEDSNPPIVKELIKKTKPPRQIYGIEGFFGATDYDFLEALARSLPPTGDLVYSPRER